MLYLDQVIFFYYFLYFDEVIFFLFIIEVLTPNVHFLAQKAKGDIELKICIFPSQQYPSIPLISHQI